MNIAALDTNDVFMRGTGLVRAVSCRKDLVLGRPASVAGFLLKSGRYGLLPFLESFRFRFFHGSGFNDTGRAFLKFDTQLGCFSFDSSFRS